MRHAVLPALTLLLACSAPSGGPDEPATRPPPTKTQFGGARPARLLAPRDFDNSVAAPLVLVLHGLGATAALQTAYFGFDRLVEEAGILVVAPEGTVGSGGQQFWNATDVCCDWDRTGVDDVAYLVALVEEIRADYNVDPKRIHVIGHSNGGFMAHRLACEHPGLFASIVSLAGARWNDASRCTPDEPVSVLQIHGDADDIVYYAGEHTPIGTYPGAVRTTELWAASDGCGRAREAYGERLDLDGAVAGADTTREAFGGCPRGIDVELWTIAGGGHLPGLGPGFRSVAWEWLAAHPKP